MSEISDAYLSKAFFRLPDACTFEASIKQVCRKTIKKQERIES